MAFDKRTIASLGLFGAAVLIAACTVPEEDYCEFDIACDGDCPGSAVCDGGRCMPSIGACDPLPPRPGQVDEGGGETPGQAEGEGEGGAPLGCMDGVRGPDEDCDASADDGVPSCVEHDDQRFSGGVLVCKPDCTVDTTGCTPGDCHDGVLTAGEVCDLAIQPTRECAEVDRRFKSGTAACQDDCSLDTSQCVVVDSCGDGRLDRWEECDPAVLAAMPCERYRWGWTGGDATCDASDCTIDDSACSPGYTCGNDVLEQGEECDDGGTEDADGCSAECLNDAEDEDLPPRPLEPRGGDMRSPDDAFAFDSVCHEADARTVHGDGGWIGVRVAAHVVGSTADSPPVTWERILMDLDAANEELSGLRIRLSLELGPVDVPLGEVDANDPDGWARSKVRALREARPDQLPLLYAPITWGGLSGGEGIVLNPRNPQWYQGLVLAHELGHFGSLSHTHACPAGVRDRDDVALCGAWGDTLCETPYDPGTAVAGGTCRAFGTSQEVCAMAASCSVACSGAPADEEQATPALNHMSYYLRRSCPRSSVEVQGEVLRCVMREEQGGVSFPVCADGTLPSPEVCNGEDDDCDGSLDTYVDRTGDTTDPNRNAAMADRATILTIGSYNNGAEGFDGVIDELRISGRVLESHELLGSSPAYWGLGAVVDSRDPNAIVQVTAGGRHSCARRRSGEVICWGYSGDAQANPRHADFTAISSGYHHICGIRSDRSLACWGSNHRGQAAPPQGEFTHVAAGGDFTCALRVDRTTACWGFEDFGVTDVPVEPRFTGIAAGVDHACGLQADGTVVCWRRNEAGEDPPDNARFVALPKGGSCGIEGDGTIRCWRYAVADDPPGGAFAALSTYHGHGCGARPDGTPVCWGDWGNWHGNPGPPANTLYQHVEAGAGHACGLQQDGLVSCWGLAQLNMMVVPADFAAP